MHFTIRKNKEKISKPRIDFAKELYMMFNNKELKENDITEKDIDKIIDEYSNRLYKSMQQFK